MNEINTLGAPLKELKLPTTGFTVKIAETLSIGQMRSLQSVLLNSGSFNSETAKVESVSPQAFLQMQDKAVEFLVREIVSPDESVIQFTQDWLYNLPFDDGMLVYDLVTEIFNNANLGKESKKN